MTDTEAAALLERAQAWADAECCAEDRRTLNRLIARARAGESDVLVDLGDRFRGALRFGTAGLRGQIGAGETRMNRAVVRRATFGLVKYLMEQTPDAARRGLVVGHDARLHSDVFARDVGGVAAALGMRVHVLPGMQPTPLVAFGVTALGAAGGVVVTASHNPLGDNGYKVYSSRGAQIVPPEDVEIAARIAAAPPARDIPIIDPGEPDSGCEVADLREPYLDALDELVFRPEAPVGRLRVVYSPLHGVGAELFMRAAERRGLKHVRVVPEQAVPDGSFPTVAFPNPEEPGALDLALACAEREQADLVLVHDPDADRLGAAVRTSGGTFRVLSGNEIGVLLADHLLANDDPEDPRRLFMTTVVSSRLLAAMVAARGARYAETLTGFKWIADGAFRLESQEGLRFVFGYEEALGYTPKTAVRDKDGIRAAMVLAEYAAVLLDKGRTLIDTLDDLALRYGLHYARSRSVRLPGAEGHARILAAMADLRARRPEALGLAGALLTDHARADSPQLRADVLVFDLQDRGRVAVRPSGTEPKLKLYLEVVERVSEPEALDAARVRAARRLQAMEESLLGAAGLV